MKAQKILLPIVAVLEALVFFSVFIIKEVNQAIVLQFGDPKRILVEPGLNFKIPFIQNSRPRRDCKSSSRDCNERSDC